MLATFHAAGLSVSRSWYEGTRIPPASLLTTTASVLRCQYKLHDCRYYRSSPSLLRHGGPAKDRKSPRTLWIHSSASSACHFGTVIAISHISGIQHPKRWFAGNLLFRVLVTKGTPSRLALLCAPFTQWTAILVFHSHSAACESPTQMMVQQAPLALVEGHQCPHSPR